LKAFAVDVARERHQRALARMWRCRSGWRPFPTSRLRTRGWTTRSRTCC